MRYVLRKPWMGTLKLELVSEVKFFILTQKGLQLKTYVALDGQADTDG